MTQDPGWTVRQRELYPDKPAMIRFVRGQRIELSNGVTLFIDRRRSKGDLEVTIYGPKGVIASLTDRFGREKLGAAEYRAKVWPENPPG
jgi:hypothetical protein